MIKAVILIQWAIWGVMLLFLWTQLISPAIKGRPFFPFFRARPRDIESRLARAREAVDIARGERELESLTPSAPASPEPAAASAATKVTDIRRSPKPRRKTA